MLNALKALLLPPLGFIVLGLVGLVLRRWHPRSGLALVGASLVLLYVVSTPQFAASALGSLEPTFVDPVGQAGAQAIVLLGGGSVGYAPEYGTDSVNALSLIRARYAAKLQRATDKPLLVTGGTSSEKFRPEAQQMLTVLRDEFGVPVKWVEDRAADTLGNALESRRLLAPEGIDTIYLVTHSWHMRRAQLAFEHVGFRVIPAPTGFIRAQNDDGFEFLTLLDFLPRASSLLNSYYFFHEVIGYLAYWVRIRL